MSSKYECHCTDDTKLDAVNEALEIAATRDKLDHLSSVLPDVYDLLEELSKNMERDDGLYYYAAYHSIIDTLKRLGYEVDHDRNNV